MNFYSICGAGYAFIAITEPWFVSRVTDSGILTDYPSKVNKRPWETVPAANARKHGGGTMIAVKDTAKSRRRDEFERLCVYTTSGKHSYMGTIITVLKQSVCTR